MPKRKDVVAEELRTLADDLDRLWRAATHDPKQEARRERVWMIVSGVLSAASTMAARKLAAKIWPILTGEEAPTPKIRTEPAHRQPPRSEAPAEQAETPATV
jgi:hypothetical protein